MPALPSPRAAVADPRRLAAVASYRLPGHAGDDDLDAVVQHLARSVGAAVVVVNLVGPDLQCYPAEHGVHAPSTSVPDELSFCAYVVAGGATLQVTDAAMHPVFRDNPLVRSGAVASYLGVPLVDEDGFVLGAVSVFDDAPREFSAEAAADLEHAVRLVRVVLSLRRRVAAHEWDARLLEVQSGVLEAVATGRHLALTLGELEASLDALAVGAGAEQLGRVRAVRDRLVHIATDAAGRREATERMAREDGLTGLANRAHFVEAGGAAVAHGGAVLFVDLDRFKEVNDLGSHALGDRVLVRLAARLQASLRAAVPGAVVGRVGGDEFAAALPGVTRAVASDLAGRLASVLVEDVPTLTGTLHVSASVGLAMTDGRGRFEVALHAADEAMYRAKRRGRGPLAVA
jgi:diguanylate cyclase (GGDEF)-like protein